MTTDDLECIYIDGQLESSITYDQTRNADRAAIDGSSELDCTTQLLLKIFSRGELAQPYV